MERTNQVSAPSSPILQDATVRSPQSEVAPRSRASAIARRLVPLLLIVGQVAYFNSFAGAFLFDDQRRILDNPLIRHLWPPWQVMAGSSRPLVQLSLAVNYALGGLNVWGYHAFNLAVHLLAGLVLLGIVRRMLESERLRPRYGRAAPWLALAVAAVWLVHPLQTESVTYIIQRAESLMGLFFLLTLYCGIRGAQSPHPWLWYTAAVMACALGMGSKEVMVAAPLVMLLYDRVFIAASFKALFRQRWGLYAGLAATWPFLGALLATSRPEEQTVMVTGLTPWRYALTQFGVIVHYLRLSVWPHPLILDYTWPPADSVFSVLPWAAVVLTLVAGTLLALSRQMWVGFWGAWFFLILAPTSSLLPLADIAFEHRMYLPLAALVVLAVIGAHEALGLLIRRGGAAEALRRSLEVGLALAAVAVLGYATVRRNEDYRSELKMWSDIVAKRPDNPRAHSNLGAAMAMQGQIREAIAHFEEAVRLKPAYPEAQRNLGRALFDEGQLKEAIPHLEEAARLRPNFTEGKALDDLVRAQAKINLGVALAKKGDMNGAIDHFAEAVRLTPNYPDAHSNLGLALAKQGRDEEAIVHYSEAVRLKPDSPDVHNDLGALLYRKGHLKEAIVQYSEALRLRPASPETHHNLGLALAKQGEMQGAIDHFAEAVRLKPDYTQAHNNLGILLYRQGRIKEAIAHFSEAVRLEPDSADALNNLRAAQDSLQQPKARP